MSLDKWRLVVSAFSNTMLDVSWSVERPKDEKKDDSKDGDGAPGPITDRTTAPNTSFGVQGNAHPDRVHRRPTIK